MGNQLRDLTSQFAVVDAMCRAMLDAVADGAEPDVDVAAAIDRHGVDPLADLLTGLVMIMAEKVAAHRGDISPAAIVDGYIRELFHLHTDELRDLVSSQVHHRSRPPVGDIEQQEAFLWGLAALHVRAVIDVPTPGPFAPVRTALEHRPHTERSEVFEHACTPDCVPAHEHPGLGCRGLAEEIRRRRTSGEGAGRRRRRGSRDGIDEDAVSEQFVALRGRRSCRLSTRATGPSPI